MKTLNRIAMTAALGTTLAMLSAQAATIHQRRENQQGRIAQGVGSGQLTAGETSRLEHGEARINREIRNDRAANGGKLTTGEKAMVQHQQNVMSNRIWVDKHNAVKQH